MSRIMKKAGLFAVLLMPLGLGTMAIAQTAAQNAPKVVVGKKLSAKAATPVPGANAKGTSQKSSVGKGATAVKASQPSAYWAEDLDVDDDGVVETSDYLYDTQRGILYTYREDDFACPNGKPESGDILMALYAKGNPAHKPVGSGWYVVNLNTGQCAAKKAGTFGCRFNASGAPTECGAATINNATGEIEVVVAQ
jgi:hypothetical protein